MPEQTQQSNANTRRQLDRVLPTDADFDAFCQDYFPIAKKRFSDGMDRLRKQNILLDLYTVEAVASQLVAIAGTLSDIGTHTDVPEDVRTVDGLELSSIKQSHLVFHVRKYIFLWVLLASSLLGGLGWFLISSLQRSSETPMSSLRRSCDSKDSSACKRLFERARSNCQHGEIDDCVSVGTYFENGLGTAKNSISAASYFRLACDQGNPRGCNNLGLMLEGGQEVTGNLEQAVSLYQRACAKKQGDGCNNLGRMYYIGKFVPRDLPKAVELFQISCNTDCLSGCISLAAAYFNGQGVPVDKWHALEIYNKLCEIYDHSIACFRAGEMYELGDGVTKDHERAILYYQKSCGFGQLIGCYNIGILTENDNPAIAAIGYEKACNGKHYRACTKLGRLYKTGRGVKSDAYQAASLFRNSCEHAEGSGCVHLGILLELGQGLPHDFVQASAYYQRGCDYNIATGCFNRARLGRLYKEVELSPQQVNMLLGRACTLGDLSACNADTKLVPASGDIP